MCTYEIYNPTLFNYYKNIYYTFIELYTPLLLNWTKSVDYFSVRAVLAVVFIQIFYMS